MSSNLGRTDCCYCKGRVTIQGDSEILDYEERLAECTRCGAQYNAWVRPPIRDLQFRASQNDEPAPEDLPIWKLNDEGIVLRAVTDDEIKRDSYFHWKYREEESDFGRDCKASQDRWFSRRNKERF